uniref:HAT C-terminal dimerisation domain-containing protein n=1 Tax=Photinus pyralis TaxID=7054 RepID=A0A1Y1M059_PHOPY
MIRKSNTTQKDAEIEDMQHFEQKRWIANPFHANITTGISTKAEEELIDLSENTFLKEIFNPQKLAEFWLSVEETYPTLSLEAMKILMPFTSSYICETGFSAMVAIKTKCRNKLQLSNSLRLKISCIKVDIDAVIKKCRKQAHASHTPHYLH